LEGADLTLSPEAHFPEEFMWSFIWLESTSEQSSIISTPIHHSWIWCYIIYTNDIFLQNVVPMCKMR
jgi:hypothetical protein